jgi:hypothetical protein
MSNPIAEIFTKSLPSILGAKAEHIFSEQHEQKFKAAIDVWDLEAYLYILDTATVVTRIENKKDELWGHGAGLPSSSRVPSRPAGASDSGPVHAQEFMAGAVTV